MRVISTISAKLAPLVSLSAPARYRLSLIVKATFDMESGAKATFAKDQIVPQGDQTFTDANDSNSAPRLATDFVPFKPRTDLLLAGRCCTPDSVPLKQCPVTFQVGDYRKSLMIFGHRRWEYRFGVLPMITESEPFTELELRYEHSFGGPEDKRNPVGRGLTGERLESGEFVHELANIEHPSRPIRSLDDCPPPAGFGPMGRNWEPRASKLGAYDKHWQETRWPCLPEDFDASFFNAAPEDMQVDGYLRGDEELYFENLHPLHSQFRCRLPGIRVRCFVNEEHSEDAEREVFRPIEMNLDTLSVDMESTQVCLVWRGVTDIRNDDFREIKHVFIHTEELGQQEQPLEIYRRLFEEQKERTEKGPDVVPNMPDLEDYKDRVDRIIAAAVASSTDAGRINRELATAFADDAVQFPTNLADMSSDEQMKALDDFGDQLSVASRKLADDRQREAEEMLRTMGINPAKHQEAVRQECVEQTRQLLSTVGLEDELRQADAEIRQTASDLYRQGIDFDELGIDIAPMCGGLAGLGVNVSELGLDLGLGAPMLTAETVVQRVANGESLKDELMAKLDLSGQRLRDGDFRDALLPDAKLSGADLSGADLSNAVMARVDLTDAQLVGANLRGANLSKADLSGANLTGAILDEAMAEEAQLVGARLDRASAIRTRFAQADLSRASAHHADFHEADFFRAQLNEADFQQADLYGSRFFETQAERVNFTAANLTKIQAMMGCQFPDGVFHQALAPESVWAKPNLAGTNWSHADMHEALFDEANLDQANLDAANLKGSRMGRSRFRQARLVSANLYQTALDRTDLTEANLSNANAFEADFFEAETTDAVFDNTNLKRTLLEGR